MGTGGIIASVSVPLTFCCDSLLFVFDVSMYVHHEVVLPCALVDTVACCFLGQSVQRIKSVYRVNTRSYYKPHVVHTARKRG